MEGHFSDHSDVVRSVSQPIFEAKGWLKLLGIVSMVYGVLTALSIIGIIFAWIPFWMGYLLYQCATLVETAQTSGDENVLKESLTKLKTYFTITGVFALIGLVMTGLFIALGFAGVFAGIFSEMSNF